MALSVRMSRDVVADGFVREGETSSAAPSIRMKCIHGRCAVFLCALLIRLLFSCHLGPHIVNPRSLMRV